MKVKGFYNSLICIQSEHTVLIIIIRPIYTIIPDSMHVVVGGRGGGAGALP